MEKRVALLIEGRRAERIVKLHWLIQREKDVKLFLAGIRAEVKSLRTELVQDHGFTPDELTGSDLEDNAGRAAAR